jgi:hypothetical protein
MTDQEIREVLGSKDIFRTQDLERCGISRKELNRLSDQGALQKLGCGRSRVEDHRACIACGSL